MVADFKGCTITSQKENVLKCFTASAISIFYLLNYFKLLFEMAAILYSCNYPIYSETLPAVRA